MAKFKVGKKVKTQNAEDGIIVSESNISGAWNVEIERKYKDKKEKVIEYYFEEELMIK